MAAWNDDPVPPGHGEPRNVGARIDRVSIERQIAGIDRDLATGIIVDPWIRRNLELRRDELRSDLERMTR